MSFDHESEWPAFRALAEAGDAPAMLERIRAVEDPAERIGLYRLVIRKMAFDPWENRTLDPMITLADAAIAECDVLGGDFLQQANLIAYNTSANLADCWDDGFPRERRHFEKGLEYARKALWYREHLGKAAANFAMATWAVAKHEQSLGMLEEAKADYRRGLEFSRKSAEEEGKPAEISADAPDGYLIAAGYLALVEGDTEALKRLRGVLDEMLATGGDPRADAELIELQLRATARNMGIETPI